jgi:S1-C subfamily serine protease
VTLNRSNPKLLESMRTRLLIAASSALVLCAGALLRPQATSPVLRVSQEHAAPLLEEEAQRRAPLRALAGLQDLGSQVAAHTVAISASVPPAPRSILDFPTAGAAAVARPAGFGVIVSSDGDVLTHVHALAGRSTLEVQMLGGGPMEAQLSAFEPDTGLVLLRLASAPRSLAGRVAAAPARAGSLAAAAGRWNGENIVAPVFVTGVRDGVYYTSGGAAAFPPGTPIFTLDGELLAVAAAGGEPGVAYPAGEALGRLRADIAAGRGQPASLGLLLQPMDDVLAAALGAKGALVSDAVPGASADAGGVKPGDVVTAIGSAPVDSPEAARKAVAALVPASTVTIGFVRDARASTLDLVAGSAFDIASAIRPTPADVGTDRPPGAGERGVLRREPSASVALRADAVFGEEALRAANVPSAALVLSIDGVAVTSRAAALRSLGRPRTAVLYLQHGGRRFFAAMPGS